MSLEQQSHSSKNQHYYSNHDEIEVINDVKEQTLNVSCSNPSNENSKDLKSHIQFKEKFKKGHRRAYSMPNANRGDKAVLLVADDQIKVFF